ncbi:MAG TPA: hypothetical protein VIF10_01185 [Methylobacter sp.]
MEHSQKLREEANGVCADLNAYLMSEFGCETPPACITGRRINNIRACTEDFDIYLACRPVQRAGWDENILVIVRIGFEEQRVGNGTSFLRFLVRMSDKYGYERIGIECATNEQIVGFAKKYGFECYEKEGDWIASVDNLKKLLERSPGDCQV